MTSSIRIGIGIDSWIGYGARRSESENRAVGKKPRSASAFSLALGNGNHSVFMTVLEASNTLSYDKVLEACYLLRDSETWQLARRPKLRKRQATEEMMSNLPPMTHSHWTDGTEALLTVVLVAHAKK